MGIAACAPLKSYKLLDRRSSSSNVGGEVLSLDKSGMPEASNAGVTLKGTCISGQSLTIKNQGSADQSLACPSGSFEVTLALLGMDGPKLISVGQTDHAGRNWQDSLSVMKDTVPPQVSILTVVRQQAGVIVNGSCEDGSSLTVGGDLLAATGMTCTAGAFQIKATLKAGDGMKDVMVMQSDKAGNRGMAQSEFMLDTTAPMLTITSPTANSSIVDAVQIKGACESGLDVISEGAGWATQVAATCAGGSYTLNGNLSAGLGSKTLVISQTDSSGNKGQASVVVNRIDAGANQPPVISILQPAAGTVARTGLTISGSCQTGLTVTISGAVATNSTAACNNSQFNAAITFSNGDGNKTITVSQTNAQNLIGSSSRNFVRDSTPPALTISNPKPNTVVGSSVTVNGTCETGLAVNVSGSGVATPGPVSCSAGAYSGLVNLSAGDGSKSISVTQTDAAQNTTSASVSITKDTAAPVVKITDPAAGTMAESGLTIKGSCESGLSVTATGTGLASDVTGACSNQLFSLDVIFSNGDGDKLVTLRQMDGGGNIGTDSRTFKKGAPLILDGPLLYAQHCQICHNPIATSTKLDRTADQILSARMTVPSMVANAAIAALTTAQIEAIAQALKTTTGDPNANPFLCQTTAKPGPARLQRLAKSEYINTLRDLFGNLININDLSAELALFPEESNASVAFDRGADSMNLGLVKAQADVAAKIANIITTSTTKVNSLFSETCLSAATVTDACLNSFIDRFGNLAYRRPVKTTERTPLIAAYRLGTSRAESSGFLLRAFLMSPHFLYHLEFDGTPNADGSALNLTAYEMASRLSYLIVNTMPDTTLMQAAANGSLNTTTGYQNQVNRLFTQTAAKDSFRRFFYHMFELNRMRPPTYSTAVKAGVNTDNINADALEEALLFSDYVLFENKSVRNLLTDNTGFIKSSELAKVYGITLPATADGRVTLPGTQRAGMLTRVAKTLSGRDGTSPIQRGITIRRSLLCESMSPPDPASLPPGTLDPPPDDPLLSTRQRYENKTSPTQCQACHGLINPPGYALEGYDALGRHRTVEKIFDSTGKLVAQHPVDSKATINMNEPPDPLVNDGIELSIALANSQKFKACVSKRWFQFSMRRLSTPQDNCFLSNMYDYLKNPNASLMDAIKATITDPEFKMRRVN